MKLIKIFTDHIQLKTNDAEFNSIRINDLLSVSDGEVELVVSVNSLTDTDTETGIDEDDFILDPVSMKVIECRIIGSVVNEQFVKAIDKYPTTDVTIRKIEENDLNIIINGSAEGWLWIGKYTSYNNSAWLDGNKLFQRHSCIVGNTGSGKSETLAKILEETSKLSGANIILFDIHGEYSRLSYVDNIRIGPDFPFPVWLFGFQDMVANILKVKEESSGVTMSALRKAYYSQCPNGNESRPVQFEFERFMDYVRQLNAAHSWTGEVYKTGDRKGEQKTVKGEYNGKLFSVINTMETMYSDKRYDFLFGRSVDLSELVNRLMGGDRPVKNIDLSDIPHDVAIPIIGAIAKLVFDIQRSTGPDFRPITLVCDEAHVYIPNNFQLSASERRMVEVFENIAKEGRKFGITLFVASQRPSELNKTIMAQCANFIVGKLNNENDKAMIKGMLPDGSESVIDSTTMFSPGDVLVVGDAAPIPLKVHVELAKERPQSRTIDFWDVWSKTERITDYSEQVQVYLED